LFNLGRERRFALLALFGLLLVCAIAPALALKARSDAGQALDDANDLVRRLTAAQRRVGDKPGGRAPMAEAPGEAFLSAQTPGLATAQLEAYLSDLAETFHASLTSSSAQQADSSDTPDIVRIQAHIDVDYGSLQPLLYKLEAGAPYVFVDSLTLRPADAASQRGVQGAPMKATLSLKAIWRQRST
jgi:general secretion pathway protein M